MDVVYTDEEWEEQGYLEFHSFDLAYGDEENDFEIVIPAGLDVPKGALVYIDGTGWGGIVRGCEASTMGDAPTATVEGSTWQGVLAESYICPTAGSHVDVSGDANDAMRKIVERQGLQGMFDVEARPSGYRVSYRFDRFADVYSGFRKMLALAGAKLAITKEPGCKPMLAAVEAERHIDDSDAGRCRYRMAESTPYNHIIGIGKGEMEERAVVHRYADDQGAVSGTQTIFWPHERQYLYELSSSEEADLIEECDKKLTELQNAKECDLQLLDGESYDVGDIVGTVDERSGRSVTDYVTKVIVKIDEYGTVSISNEVGGLSSSSRASAGPSSGAIGSAGGVYYAAGDGIDISGNTISADVTAGMLEEARMETAGKADAVHSHSASDISSGTLGIERGGTGASTAAGARKSIGAAPMAHSHQWSEIDDKPATYAPSEHSHHDMAGATASANGMSGMVPAPTEGEQTAFLRGDGSWSYPNDTTYQAATQAADGLMSAADKKKLDGIGGKYSVVVRSDDTSPASLYGGAWEKINSTHLFIGVRLWRRVG